MKKLLLMVLSSQICTLTLAMETLIGVQFLLNNDVAPLLELIKLPSLHPRNNHRFILADFQRTLELTPKKSTEQFVFQRSARQKRITQTTSKL